VNPRNLRLRCSHWEPVAEERPSKRMGCVIYLHGNSGSRMDAAENVVMLLHSFRLTYFAFDFAGAGQSEGLCLTHPPIRLSTHAIAKRRVCVSCVVCCRQVHFARLS
jgi:hypothetical protein